MLEYLRWWDWKKSFVNEHCWGGGTRNRPSSFYRLWEMQFPYNWRNNIPKEHWLWKNVYICLCENRLHSLWNFQINLIFARLHYFCDVSEEKYANARKHFVLSPYLKFAKISMRDRRNQCSFCVYAGYVRSVRRPRIYHGVGILFLHCSFG